MKRERPVGILDSGVGGLSILHKLVKTLPNEHFVYIGDNARFPYGNKKPDVVKQYGLELAKFLVNKGVKAIIVACGTLSSYMIEATAQEFHLPIFGVIKPTVKELDRYKAKQIIVWATPTTIDSGSYQKELRKSKKKICYQPCPTLAGAVESQDNYSVALPETDAIILGCTHYSWLNLPKNTAKIDSSWELPREVKGRLRDNNLLSKIPSGQSTFYFTGDTTKATHLLSTIFKQEVEVKKINLKEKNECA